MASFSFLHAADIHLDSPLAGLSRYEGVPAAEIRAAPRAAFDRLIETAIERRVDFVVIAGDLYDGDWKDMGTGLYFAAAMGRLGRANIPVYLLAGNHDARSVITRDLPPVDGVHHFSTRTAQTHRLPHLDVAIHGRSFAERSAPENLVPGYPEPVARAFNIGVLHTSLAGYAAHETYAPCTPQELIARGYDYWALGHVHEHQIVAVHPHIVFPGNLQGRHIREDGPRGAVLVHVRDGEVAELERLELDVVRWATATVQADVPDAAALHTRIRDALRQVAAGDRPMVVRVVLAGCSPLHDALQDPSLRLRDDVRGIAAELSVNLWIEKLQVRTTPPAAQPETAADADGIGQLIPPPDDRLAEALRAEFSKFFVNLPQQDDDSSIRQAAQGQWTALMTAAGAALRHRLGIAG